MSELWGKLGVSTKVITATLVVLASLLLGGAYLIGQQLQSDLNHVLSTQAKIVEKQIQVTRAYVAKQFVVKAKGAGMKVSMDHTAPDTIPFPATFTRETSEALAKEGVYDARVISSTPLNPANAPRDSFEKKAVAALENGKQEYTTTELVNGQLMFRRATVDVASVNACVGCHEGKQVGDMLGAVSVQIPMDTPMAQLNTNLRNMYLGIFGVGVLMLGLLYLTITRLVGKPLQGLEGVAKRVSEGDLAARVEVTTQDELGQLGDAFNTMASEIEANTAQQAQANQEMSRIKTALDNASTNVMVCDRNYQIIFNNKASEQTLRAVERDIQQVMPSFAVDKVVGSMIDQYHKNPAHQRRLLDDPKNLPYRTEIQIGPLTLDLGARAIMSDTGEYLGNVVEWRDVTAEKKAQNEVDALIGAAAQGELSNRINADGFSGFFRTLSTGINQLMEAIATPLAEAQQVLTALAEGDLSKKVAGDYAGEFDKIKTSVNGAIDNLTGIVTAVRDGAAQVSTGSEEITKGNEDLSQRTSAQAGALEETSASMEEMTSTIKQNADNAKQANQLAVTAREVAEKGGAVTEKAVECYGMKSTRAVRKLRILLMSLMRLPFKRICWPSMQPWKPHEPESRVEDLRWWRRKSGTLAQRSATAAKEIKTLINESVQKVGDGSELRE